MIFEEFEDVLKPIRAAKMIQRDTQTLANWRWAGKGPAFIRDGRRVLYLKKDLVEWLLNRRVEPGK